MMRTIKGQDAIEIAKNQGVPLYDVFYRHEVSAAEAKEFIDSRRDPQSFVLENWPDSEEEAEEVMLRRFHTALVKGQLHQARILDVIAHPNGGVRIHPHAARLAADRLVEQGKLEQVQAEGEPAYRMVRNVRISDGFFDELDSMVCEDCAKLNFDRPFHETCLTLIMEHFRQFATHLPEGLEMVGQDSEDSNGLSRFLRINGEMLSRGLDEAKSRWQSVIKARIAKSREENATQSWSVGKSRVSPTDLEQTIDVSAARQGSGLRNVFGNKSELQHTDSTKSGVDNGQDRLRITKQDLIDYLKNVEILDETGEVGELRERESLLSEELGRRDEMVHQLEKQRSFMEKQFDEMKRDMDTLVQAMQIAKKRSSKSENIIDVPMGETSGH